MPPAEQFSPVRADFARRAVRQAKRLRQPHKFRAADHLEPWLCQFHEFFRRALLNERPDGLLRRFSFAFPLAARIALTGRFHRHDALFVLLPHAEHPSAARERSVCRIKIRRAHVNFAQLLLRQFHDLRVAQNLSHLLDALRAQLDFKLGRHKSPPAHELALFYDVFAVYASEFSGSSD